MITPLPFEVPVVPDGPEGRRLASEELERSIYQGEDWILRIFRAIDNFLQRLFTLDGAVPVSMAPLVLLAIVAVVVALAFALSGPVRRRRRATILKQSGQLFDTQQSAAELDQDAQQAARAGDWSRALVQCYRAIIRSLDERVLLEDRPGLTAHEAAALAAAVFPDHTRGLQNGANLFDEVRYGEHHATEADYHSVAQLQEAIRQARPVRERAVIVDAPSLPLGGVQ